MAREKMVTRTVSITMVKAMIVDVTTANVAVKEFELTGNYNDNEAILKALKKVYETGTIKVVSIQEVSEKETLYGMPEIEFIRLAKVLPPRTKTE